MSDLISRSELFNRLATVQTLGEAYAVIQDMPTKEPEVIRCKDCAKWNANNDRDKARYGLCEAHTQLIVMNRNDFCSYAERRELCGS